jgi:biotin carboxylase
MRALGDKIGSTIIGQNVGVPCIAWNRSRVAAEYDQALGTLPEWALAEACVMSAIDASRAASEFDFPFMIKRRAYAWSRTGGTCRTLAVRSAARSRGRPSSS